MTQVKCRAAIAARLPFDDSPQYLCRCQKMRLPCGDWLVLSSWAQLLSMSDIGFASAAGNDMTMRVGRGDRQGAVAIYQSVWLTLLGLSALALGLVVAMLWLGGGGYLPVTHVSPSDSSRVLMILSATVILNLQLGLIATAFRCDGLYATSDLMTSALRLGEFLAQLAAALATRSLVHVALISLLIRAAAILIFLGVLRQMSPWLILGWKSAKIHLVRRLMAPALSFLGIPVGQAIIIQGMLNVVAVSLGSSAVVVFDAHRRLTNSGMQLIGMVNHSVWPELSRAEGSGDAALTRRLHRAACSLALWLAAACAILILSLGWIILPAWTSGRIHQDFALLVFLTLAVIARALWYTSATVLMSSNRHQRLSVCMVLSGLVSLGTAFVIMPWWGVSAAGFGTLCAELILLMFVLPCVLVLTDDSLRGFADAVRRPYALLRGSAKHA